MLAESVPSSCNATSSQASPPSEPSVASSTGRKRRTDDILRSYDIGSCSTDSSLPGLQQTAVNEERCTVQLTTSSRRTRRWILGAQTNAATDPTSQYLSRHKPEVVGLVINDLGLSDKG